MIILDFETNSTNIQKKITEKLKSEYEVEKVKKILGTGIKKLAESEKDNYKTTRRSIKAMVKISIDELITEKNISILRSEKNLSPGLGPEYFDIICNKKAKKTIEDGHGITWEHVI